jgi:hypothetical protein
LFLKYCFKKSTSTPPSAAIVSWLASGGAFRSRDEQWRAAGCKSVEGLGHDGSENNPQWCNVVGISYARTRARQRAAYVLVVL